jgi:hypothetical protein
MGGNIKMDLTEIGWKGVIDPAYTNIHRPISVESVQSFMNC